MDGDRFDNLTRALARGVTRRTAVKGAASGLLGALGLRTGGAAGQVSVVDCGNFFCESDPGSCRDGCVCCIYRNSRGRITNSRCLPPGFCGVGGTPTCPPGEVLDPDRGCVPAGSTTTTTTRPPRTTTTRRPTTTSTTSTTTTLPATTTTTTTLPATTTTTTTLPVSTTTTTSTTDTPRCTPGASCTSAEAGCCNGDCCAGSDACVVDNFAETPRLRCCAPDRVAALDGCCPPGRTPADGRCCPDASVYTDNGVTRCCLDGLCNGVCCPNGRLCNTDVTPNRCNECDLNDQCPNGLCCGGVCCAAGDNCDFGVCCSEEQTCPEQCCTPGLRCCPDFNQPGAPLVCQAACAV